MTVGKTEVENTDCEELIETQNDSQCTLTDHQ